MASIRFLQDIDIDGNVLVSQAVGIGTSIPSAKLNIVGDASSVITEIEKSTGESLFKVQDLTNPVIISNHVGGWTTWVQNKLTTGTRSGLLLDAGSSSGDWNFYARSADTNTFYMGIRGDGNIGIGTSSPSAKTDIVGDNFGRTLRLEAVNATKSNGLYTLEVDSSAHTSNVTAAGALKVDVNSGTAMVINGQGDVGFGTSSIINSTGYVRVSMNDTSGAILEQKVNNVASSRFITSPSLAELETIVSMPLSLGTNNTEAIRIDTSQNVGINQTSPSAKLHIVGDSNTSGTTALLVENSSGDNTLEIRNNGTLLQNIVNAPSSIAIGLGALTSITTTFGRLVAVGYNALDANTSGYDNTAVGHSALTANTTGSFNTAIGKSALTVNTTGSHNTAVGVSSLDTNSTGNYNTALGKSALRLATSNYNTGVGYQAAEKTSTGTQNVALGAYSLFSNTTGNRNISIGSFSIEESISGSDNIAIGDRAGEKAVGSVSNTTPSTSIYIGNSVTPNANNEQNQIIIGHQGVGFGSNTATFGNSSITTTHLYGQLSLEDYGSGTYTGTAAYTLAVDASGNIIETSGGGGSTPTLQEVTTAGNTTTDDVGIQMSNPVSALHIGDGNNTVSSALYSTDIVNVSAQNTAPGFNIISAGTSSFNRGVFKATRSRGTLASPSAAVSGDYVFSLLGVIYDGTSSYATAGVEMLVDGAVSTGNTPQRIEFQTGTTTSRSTKMTIKSDGDIGVNTTNPLAKLHLVGADTSVATDALLIENSGGSDLFKITNSGNFYMSSASRFASIVINNVDTVGTGNYSTIVGYQAGDGTNTNGLYLTAIGARAAQLTNGGTFSVAIGMNSARNAGSLSNAVVVGMNAVNNSGGFSNSVAVGRSAAEQSNLTTSTIVGYYAGRAMGTTQRSNNVYIGYNVASSSNNQSGNTFIGSNIQSSSTEALNNTVIIGSSSQERLRVSADGDVTWTGGNYMKIQTGTTASRPSSPVAGMIRFNTTTGKYEGYVDSITGWVNFH